MIASAETHSLMPSRITTWVAASAAVSPSASATRRSTEGSMLLYVPTAPEIFDDADRLAGLAEPVADAGHREREVGDPVAPDVRLGVDAVGAADPQRVAVRQRVVAQCGDEPVGLCEQRCRSRR